MYRSQIGQDRWVESVLGRKRDGFFVELGACDGMLLSNSFFFEKELGWNGICIEPNDSYVDALSRNRTCFVSNDLISSESGRTVEFSFQGEYSGILDGTGSPFLNRKIVVEKRTKTLAEVLSQFSAPEVIDYLSLDVEGHEVSILSTFPFDKYKFRCITVEHNEPHVGSKQRLLIREILERNGYKFVKGNDDVCRWGVGPIDDFYVFPSLV